MYLFVSCILVKVFSLFTLLSAFWWEFCSRDCIAQYLYLYKYLFKLKLFRRFRSLNECFSFPCLQIISLHMNVRVQTYCAGALSSFSPVVSLRQHPVLHIYIIYQGRSSFRITQLSVFYKKLQTNSLDPVFFFYLMSIICSVLCVVIPVRLHRDCRTKSLMAFSL